MNILALSDQELPALWDHFRPERLEGVDLILSCGDLDPQYLSFLVTMAHCPVLYVHGNHDVQYDRMPPEGCDCIDGKLVVYNGLRILGLGGCRWYHPGPHQHTEGQMRSRIRKLRLALWRTKGVDILVTHAPPRGCGDGEDNAHIGFQAFLPFLEKYRPAYLLHGHVHLNYDRRERVTHWKDTQIINCWGQYRLTVPDKPVKPKDRDQLLWKNGAPKLPDDDEGPLR